jgi:hypothetical protein
MLTTRTGALSPVQSAAGLGLGDGLVTAITLFEVDRRLPGDGKPAVVYIRDQRRPTPERTIPPSGRRVGADTTRDS